MPHDPARDERSSTFRRSWHRDPLNVSRDRVGTDEPISLDLRIAGEVGLWCSLPAAISSTPIEGRPPRLHLHVRPKSGGQKRFDTDVESLLVSGSAPVDVAAPVEHFVTPTIALDFLRSARSHQMSQSTLLRGCRDTEFTDTFTTPHRNLDLDKVTGCTYTIWASTPAIIWTARRPQEVGIHVHVERGRKRLIDDTFGAVRLHGIQLERADLLEAMFERIDF
jgi:hypothetical protein